MKSKFLIVIILIPLRLFCQNLQPEVYLFTTDETPSMIKFVNNQALSKDDSVACSKLVSSKNKIEELSDKKNITGLKGDFLIIVFRDIKKNIIVPFAQGNINSFEIFNLGNKKTILQKSFSPQEASELPDNYYRINLKEIIEFPYAYSISRVQVKHNNNTTPNESYFRYLTRFSSYGNIIKHSPIGLWFPVGQFGTNLKKTPQGIIFNALPVGLALGTKFNFCGDFYIGISYSLDYTITKSNDSTNTFSFNSFSHGPILDFGDYFHVGYNWFTNLTNNSTNNRQPFFVVGIGVEFLDILKNKKSK